MERYQELLEQAKAGGFNLKEYLTRSEGPALFTNAINDKLLQGAQPELGQDFNRIYDTVTLVNRRNISFPSIRGVNPDLVPELAEFKFTDFESTSITVTPQKFGMRIGISREMIEDNEVGLIGWRSREAGRSHRELDRREHFKALSFYSTGPAVSTGVVGIRDHGQMYAQGGYTNFITATALSWEVRINRAITTLQTQTITVGDMVISFPVIPDTIVANPVHQIPIQKVLNTVITVAATGVGSQAGDAANVAGNNVFMGKLPIQIYDPTIPAGQAFILQSKRGLVSVQRDSLATETWEDRAFDADQLKTRSRYLPAVIEERFVCDLQITG